MGYLLLVVNVTGLKEVEEIRRPWLLMCHEDIKAGVRFWGWGYLQMWTLLGSCGDCWKVVCGWGKRAWGIMPWSCILSALYYHSSVLPRWHELKHYLQTLPTWQCKTLKLRRKKSSSSKLSMLDIQSQQKKVTCCGKNFQTILFTIFK